MRRAAKTDENQQEIVDELRENGYIVEIIGRPVDLLVRHKFWRSGVFVAMEIKVANRKDGTYRERKDQPEQIKFCDTHGVPYVTNSQQALIWLSMFDLN